jgi:hypothetical protein
MAKIECYSAPGRLDNKRASYGGSDGFSSGYGGYGGQSDGEPKRLRKVAKAGGGEERKSGLGDVCRDFNTEKGCARATCRYGHLCSSADEQGKICRSREHNAIKHK